MYLKFQAEEASRYLLNLVRIEQLTNDMSWRVGIPHKVAESKWTTSVPEKIRTMTMIREGFLKITRMKQKKKLLKFSQSCSNLLK